MLTVHVCRLISDWIYELTMPFNLCSWPSSCSCCCINISHITSLWASFSFKSSANCFIRISPSFRFVCDISTVPNIWQKLSKLWKTWAKWQNSPKIGLNCSTKVKNGKKSLIRTLHHVETRSSRLQFSYEVITRFIFFASKCCHTVEVCCYVVVVMFWHCLK